MFILSSFFLYYITFLEKNEEIRAIYSNIAIDLTSGAAFVASLLIVKSKKEVYDKSFLFLAIGMGLFFSAEVTYTFYQNICKIPVAYPTVADLLWLAGYPFLGAYFYKTIKILHETKRLKLYSIIIVSVITGGLVGNHIYVNFFTAQSESQIGPECLGPIQYIPRSGTIIELTYYIADGILLMPAVVILINLRIKDPFFIHRILISAAVIIIFLGDIVFVDYQEGFWWSWLLLVVGDILYNFGYICFALGLIWYYKISQLLDKNLEHCIQQSDVMAKSIQQFIETDNSQLRDLKSEGIFENINDPIIAHVYFRRLLNDAKNVIQLALSPETIGLIMKKKEIYDPLLIKAKQPDVSISIFITYDKATDALISKISKDSGYKIKIQYIRKLYNPNQILLIVDNKFVLSLTIEKNESTEDIKSAMYSNKESVVSCYTTMIDYRSLLSEI